MEAEKPEIELTPKQIRFCEEYVIDWNGTRAAIAAGYSVNSARQLANENLRKDYLIKHIRNISEKYETIRKKRARDRVENDNGNIYIIKCSGTNYYKIGKSINSPKLRMGSMQTSIPFDLEIVFEIQLDNHSKLEKKLHQEYDMFHVRGEWFCFSDKILNKVIGKIKQLCKTQKKK